MRIAARLAAAGAAVALAVLAGGGAAGPPEREGARLFRSLQEGGKALAEKRYADAVRALGDAVRLAPEQPRLRLRLARALAGAGQGAAAIDQLAAMAALGFGGGMGNDPAFAALRGEPRLAARFAAIAAQADGDQRQVGTSRLVLTIAEPDLIPEGMAHDPATDRLFFGSILQRKILVVERGGQARNFVPPEGFGLGEVLGLKVAGGRRELLACSTAMAPDRTASGLYRFNLATGRLNSRAVLLGSAAHRDRHRFNDLVVTRRGDVYLTDSEEGTVYRFRAGSIVPERLVPSGTLAYPNGIAMSDDERQVYVAHVAGISRFEPATPALRLVPLPHPAGTTLVGIDGLYYDRGRLVAVQSSVDPVRLIELPLDATGKAVTALRVLLWRTPELSSPTTGAVVGDELYFMANTQADAVDDDGRLLVPRDKLQPIAVRAVRLPPPPPPRTAAPRASR
jgi:hypothetical protein